MRLAKGKDLIIHQVKMASANFFILQGYSDTLTTKLLV